MPRKRNRSRLRIRLRVAKQHLHFFRSLRDCRSQDEPYVMVRYAYMEVALP